VVSFSDFQKFDFRVGKIKNVEEIEGLDKLYKLEIDLGEDKLRTILAGVKEFLQPYELLGKSVVVVANLESRDFRGVLSEGMILAADDNGRPVLIAPEEKVKPGTVVR
jgi:methionine--tRNA ligase beta chain